MRPSPFVRWTAWAWALAALAGCARPPEEAQLREALAEIEAGVEDRSPGAIAEHLAEDFVGPAGMDKTRAQAYAGALLWRHQGVSVVWKLRSLELNEGRARTRLTAALTGRGTLSAFDGRTKSMDVDLGWRKDEGEWKVVHAQWVGTWEP